MEPIKIETDFEVVSVPQYVFVVTARAMTINDDLICTQHGFSTNLQEAEDAAVDRLMALVKRINNANTKRAA